MLALLTLTTMAGTATMGGEIRHPEMMMEGAEPTAGPTWISAAYLQSLVTDHTWLWPSFEALHFIGLWLLFGIVLLVNLRMLGMMKAASFSALHRMLPWAVLGLGINVVTGMMWVIATPEQYSSNVSFFWKIGFLLLAGDQPALPDDVRRALAGRRRAKKPRGETRRSPSQRLRAGCA